MDKGRILVVEDEEDILELLRVTLAKAGFEAQTLTSGEETVHAARADPPQLLLLDLMLPGMDGLEVCRVLKRDAATDHVPIVMLTARGEDSDIVAGLELGADDYVTKPFSPRVLTARLQAVLRRQAHSPADDGAVVRVHNLVVDPGRHEARVDGNPVPLTFTEFHLLHGLARRPGWVFTRNQIVEMVRGYDYHVTDRAVDVQVVGLRKKLGGAGGNLIETVRGVGYRFRE